METEEISDRFVAPFFVNGLEAYDEEINIGVEENMMSNEFVVKLCLDHEGVFGRSFLCLTKAIVDFGSGTVTIYPELDPFLVSSDKEEKIGDDWDLLLDDLEFQDILDIEGIDVSQFVFPEHTTVKTPMNMSPKNKAYFLAEKEAIHLILTGIGDDIYSTVDACQIAQEMWEAIKRLARNANPLALVATAQADRDQYYQTSRSHRSSAPSPKPSIPSRSHTSTRHKDKEIAKPITPPSEIYKPTNNNLRTSSNFKNKNVDTTPRLKNDNQPGQFGNPRTVNVVVVNENVRSKVVQQYGIQCFNCKEYGHFAKEYRKPKRVKDSAYHKEKMLLCKQAEQGVPLQAEHYDWLADTDEEVDKQEREAQYSYMAKIQEVPTADSGIDSKQWNSNTCLVETDDSNVTPDSPDMCEDDIKNEQNDVESDDERVTLANLIANLKLDTNQAEFEKYKAFNDRTVDYDKLERKLNEALGQLAQKGEKGTEKSVDTKFDKPSVVQQPNAQRIPKPLVLGKPAPFSNSLGRIYSLKTMSVSKANVSKGLSKLVTTQTLPQTARQAVAFKKSTCFVRDLQGNDLLTGNHGSDLYMISLQESTSSTLLCLMVKATPTQAWLWHRRIFHLNFNYINLLSKKDIVIGLPKLKYVKDQLCSSCVLSKAKRSSFKSKAVPSLKGRLNLLHMDLCGPMWVASINGKKYILVIVNDYSSYTWTLFLRSKDERPEMLKDFLTMIQRNL
nr:Gag-Pol polyprotein [Tanacetum cinerariifolium]